MIQLKSNLTIIMLILRERLNLSFLFLVGYELFEFADYGFEPS